MPIGLPGSMTDTRVVVTASAGAAVDLFAFGRYAGRLWYAAVTFVLAGLVGAFIYLNFATPRYAAVLHISPASSTASGMGGTLGQIGSLAAMAGVSVRQASTGATPFELYLDRMQSRSMAEQLARNQRVMRSIFNTEWDVVTRTWHQPPSLFGGVGAALRMLAGQPARVWRPPDAARLQDYLQKKLGIVPPKPKDPPITTLVYEHRDPAFAVYLLTEMHTIADADVRRSSLFRARQYALHLAQKLAETPITEHRQSLSEALLEQQRAIMMATSSASFAAIPTEPATASLEPVSPKVVQTLIVGLAIGTLIGLLGLFALFLWAPTRRGDRPARGPAPAAQESPNE